MTKTAPLVTMPEADVAVDAEEELQARVAWHYYIGNMTQQEIAHRIGSNRVRVNRLLAAGRESGLVQITINSRIAPCIALEQQLVERFELLLLHQQRFDLIARRIEQRAGVLGELRRFALRVLPRRGRCVV